MVFSQSARPLSILRLIVACLLVFVVSDSVLARTRFHVVIVAVTNDKTVGPKVAKDVGIISRLFVDQVPKRDLNFRIVTGNRASGAGMVKAIRDLNVGSRDSLIFFFTGHGAFEVNRNEHVMKSTDGLVARSTVRKALLAKKARLTVLMTNTCSNFIKLPAPTSSAKATASRLFKSLFIDQNGLVDISCTMPGEYGLTTTSGSVFPKYFMKVMKANFNKRLAWAQVIFETNKLVKTRYSNQTLYAVRPIGGRGTGSGSRPGVRPGNTGKGIAGTIKKTHMTHNQRHRGRKGAWITVNFQIGNAVGKQGYIRFYFNCLTCKKRVLAVSNSSYRNGDGEVQVSYKFVPKYKSTVFSNVRVFIPYRELSRRDADHTTLSCETHLHVVEKGREGHISKGTNIRFFIK